MERALSPDGADDNSFVAILMVGWTLLRDYAQLVSAEIYCAGFLIGMNVFQWCQLHKLRVQLAVGQRERDEGRVANVGQQMVAKPTIVMNASC